MKRNKILIIGLVIVITYLAYTINEHGLLNSISKSAKYQPWLFVFFIWAMCASLAIAGNSYLSSLAAGFLATIGTITGYNPEMAFQDLQNWLHVFFTIVAIALAMFDIIGKGWNILKKYELKSGLILASALVSIFCLFTALFTHYNVKFHTYWIELEAIFTVFVYFFYYNLKIDKK